MNSNIQVAGAIDDLDVAPCSGSECSPTPGVGRAGVYFSTDGGAHWAQPTYRGYGARTDRPGVGPIGTLPNFYEAGLVSKADPVLAYGPRRASDGTFSYANGTTLYYALLAGNISGQDGAGANSYRSPEAITVSRTSDIAGAMAGDNEAWSDPVIVNSANESRTTGSDKEWIWVDNAATSPYFGNVYVCFTRGGISAGALPIVCSRSNDGGATFSTPRQVSSNAGSIRFRIGVQVRTDSHGGVYVIYLEVGNGGYRHVMSRSRDGGATYDAPRAVAEVTSIGQTDPLSASSSEYLNASMDGYGGTRVVPLPSLDIANGAPTGL
ncbi:MAG: glycoside hydrolase, partial [Actinobacteria bacterium]|nr:glycoside hydrolase [Actinomycetota bacterium]